jgi:hypothetical protein
MKTKTKINIITTLFVLSLAVTSRASVVVGSWQNDTGDGWIDNGNGLSITNAANAVKYQFVPGAVTGYAQSLEINQAGYNQNLELDLATIPGGRAAFLANHTLSFTVTFPPAAASGATAGYSQIYAFTFNSAGGNTNIPWAAFTGNSGNMPGVGYYSSFGGQTITVTWDYSQLLTNPLVTNSSFLQIWFTSNNGGGAPTNIFMNNIVLAGAGSAGSAVQTYVVDDFSPNGVGPQNPTTYDYYSSSNNYAAGQITNVWGNWFGGAFQSIVWDGSTDASNNPSSGSMMITANWANGNQFEIWDQGSGNNFFALNISALQYTNFQCDVKFAAGSATDNGTFGTLQFGDRTSSYGQDYFSGGTAIASTDTNWVHISIPLNPATDVNLTNIQGLLIHIYDPNLTGTSTFWVDNIAFTGPVNVAPVVPPVLSLQKANPGLRVFAGSTANVYDREELATTDNNQSWIGGTFPVSYSFTLQDYNPGINQTHVFIVPANTSGQANMGNAGTTDEYIEYQASNTLWLIINPYTNSPGYVTASVQWKTNLPNANPNVTAASLTNQTAVGTWTMTFNSATTGTLTAPGGKSASINISDPNVATDFANPAVAYFGIQPNSTAGEGQYIDYASISVTGVSGTQESENFASEPTFNASGQWANNSAQATSIQLVTTNTPYWIYWNLPAIGYGLGTAETVTGNVNTQDAYMLPEYYNGYADGPTIPNQANQGTNTWVLIPADCLPTVDGTTTGAKSPDAFFRLFNPPLVN